MTEVKSYSRTGRHERRTRTELAPVSGREYRHELKFYLNEKDSRQLRNQVGAVLRPDRHAEGGGYVIRSLYFDDRENSGLWEKFAGVRDRKKYRIRIYNYEDNFIRLERKVKFGDMVSKDMLALTREETDAIIAGDAGFLVDKHDRLATDFYLEIKNRGMAPVAIVDYYREPYVYPVEEVRVTFDIDLRSGLWNKQRLFDPDIPLAPVYPQNLSVLEVKFNRFLPELVRGVLNNIDSPVQTSISKYNLCRMYD